MTNRQFVCLLIFAFLFVASFYFAEFVGVFAGGINTAGGLCPDGVQDYGTRYWKTLPTSDGMVDEGVSDKWDHVQMNLFICNDGSVMGRADFRPGKKGR